MTKQKFSSFEDLRDFGEVLEKREESLRHSNAERVFIELEDFSEYNKKEELKRCKRHEYNTAYIYALITSEFQIKEISEESYQIFDSLGMPDGTILCKGARWQIRHWANELKHRHLLRMEAEGKIKPRPIPKKWR